MKTAERTVQRGGGGLVTALTGLAQHVDATWIAAADTQADKDFKEGDVPLEVEGKIRGQIHRSRSRRIRRLLQPYLQSIIVVPTT